MILETKDRKMEIQIKLRLADKFEKEVCNEEQNLMTVLPSMALAKDSISNMVNILSYFQAGDNLLPKEDEEKYDIYDFLDDYLYENKKSVIELYQDVLKEFDVRGIFARGMGFKMAKTLADSIQSIMDEMDKATQSQENQDTED